MNGKPITSEEIKKITELRQTGHSLPEIRKIMKRGNSTIYKYIENIPILEGYRTAWQIKRGGNKRRSEERWIKAEKSVRDILSNTLSKNEQLLILASLYWGEGTKKEFGIINSDPAMIRAVTRCLLTLGVPLDRFRISVRIYEDLDRDKVINFWARIIGVKPIEIRNVNILRGKKVGKLEYGMCRIRITRGQDIFKILQSAIKMITVKLTS